MKFTKLFAAIAIAVTMTACGQQVVSDNSLEEARMTAKANAEFNAQVYRASNPRFTSDFNIVGRSDTTQKAECPQGDGWAQLSIMKVDGKVVDKTVLMCSTYSPSVGCFRQEDFAKDPQLANEDGRCNSKVPFPLPVLKK